MHSTEYHRKKLIYHLLWSFFGIAFVDWFKWIYCINDVPVMKGRNSFFKLYHLRPFITGTSISQQINLTWCNNNYRISVCTNKHEQFCTGFNNLFHSHVQFNWQQVKGKVCMLPWNQYQLPVKEHDKCLAVKTRSTPERKMFVWHYCHCYKHITTLLPEQWYERRSPSCKAMWDMVGQWYWH